MEIVKKLIERMEKPTSKPRPFTHARYPIGTWKMPCWVPSAAYSQASRCGVMIPGTGKPKGQ